MLENLKAALINQVEQVHFDMRSDLEYSEYPSYFAGLGKIIADIDQMESLSQLFEYLEKGNLEQHGFFPGDKESYEECVKYLIKRALNGNRQ